MDGCAARAGTGHAMNQAFSDDGTPVQAVAFDFDAVDSLVDTNNDDLRRVRQETTVRLLQFLATRASARACGQRVLLLAFLAGASDCKTQLELAKRLGVTPSRVSQTLKSLRSEFARLARV